MVMKKILVLLICFQISILPIFAAYDFSDEAQAEFDRQREIPLQQNDYSKKKNKFDKADYSEDRRNFEPSPLLYENVVNKPFYGSVVKVPVGTSFYVTFDSGISSGSVEKDDRLAVRLTNDWVINGKVIAPAGSLVYGTATYAKNAGYAYGSGALEINFNEIMTSDGNLLKISTENIYMEEKSERAVKMTRDVVIGALGSMLIGAAFTALNGSDDWGRNMLIYGGIGAAGGGIRGAMNQGKDVKIPDGTTIQVKLKETLDVTY